MYTPLQAYRELPFGGFSPYHPVKTLPKGAYLGQTVKTNSPDNATFRVMRAQEEIGTDGEETPKMVVSDEWQIEATPDLETVAAVIPKGTARFSVIVTAAPMGNTMIPDNRLTGSKVFVTDGTGEGATFYIANNRNEKNSSGQRTNKYEITVDPPAPVELDSDSDLIIRNQFYSQVAGGPNDRKINGIALTVIPENHYFLALVRGIVPMQMAPSITKTTASPTNRAVSESRGSNTNRIKIAAAGERVIGHILNPSENIEPNAWYLINFNVV